MSENIVRSFNLTVSVKEDISDEAVKYLKKWVEKTCKYWYVVVENDTSKRHLHACLFYDECKNPKNMKDTIWKHIKQYHPTSIAYVAVNIHAMPGKKWLDEYLNKDSTRDEITTKIPINEDREVDWAELEKFIPSETIQNTLMGASKKKDGPTDTFYGYHEVEYKAWLEKNTWVSSTQTAAEYFGYRMFESKDMRVIADSRRVHQMSVALHKYSTDSGKLTNKEISMHVQENCANDYCK